MSKDSTITGFLKTVVKRYGDLTALSTPAGNLTYRELNNRSNCLARAVLKGSSRASDPVAILLDDEAAHLTAILGVLKAGRAYLSLDPSFPLPRLRLMLDNAGVSLLITNRRQYSPVAGLTEDPITPVFVESVDFSKIQSEPELSISPEGIANIFYTSGSTGQPKGVMQNHQNVLHNVRDVTGSYNLTCSDRIALLNSTSFAASQTPIFGALLNGATLCPYSLQGDRLVGLASWLATERVTFYLSVPSTFRRFCQTLSGGKQFPDLRLIVLGGETVTRKDVELFKRFFSDQCMLCVRLASTETFRIRTYVIDKETPIRNERIPVGYAVRDKEVVLTTESGRPVTLGEVGEIVVKSPYLSPGYWKNPSLTQTSFLRDPENEKNRIFRTGNLGRMQADGCLEFLGRKDSQTKIRGYRVEPGETEQALLDLENIQEAAVVALEDSQGEKYLAAYLSAESNKLPGFEKIRRDLQKRLPDYMIPARFIRLEKLPQTPTGKVDRQRLPAPELGRPEMKTPYIAPRNELEAELTLLCEEVLDIHPIGIRDQFIDLGADSLNYVLLSVEIEKRFGRPFPLPQFLADPTVEHLTDLLGTANSKEDKAPPDHPWTKTSFRQFDDNTWLKRLAKQVIFQSMKGVGWVLPYGLMNRTIAWYCDRAWVQTSFLKSRVRPFRELLPFLDCSTSERQMIGSYLSNKLFRDFRLAQIARLPRWKTRKYIKVQGFERVRKELSRGSGLILLNSHYGPPHFDLLILDRNGIDDVLTLGGWPTEIQLLGIERWHQLKMKSRGMKRSEKFLFSLLAMREAETQLRRGGIVRIAPDSIHGRGGISHPFFGRLRHFRAGFAELAVETNAAVVPVFMRMMRNGQIQVELLEPLRTGSTDTEESIRIESLICQYSTLLENAWHKDPCNLTQLSIQRFLPLPFLGDSEYNPDHNPGDGDPESSEKIISGTSGKK